MPSLILRKIFTTHASSTMTVVLDCSRLGTTILSAAGGGICLNALVGERFQAVRAGLDGVAGMHQRGAAS